MVYVILEPGFYIRIGTDIYQIRQIEEEGWHRITVTLAAGQSVPYDIDGTVAGIPSLKPSDNEVYWIDQVGINGGITLLFKYPNTTTRMTAHGVDIELTRKQASWLRPWRVNFAVKPTYWPSIVVTEDNGGAAVTADIWFYFHKFTVSAKLPALPTLPSGAIANYTQLVDWSSDIYTPPAQLGVAAAPGGN